MWSPVEPLSIMGVRAIFQVLIYNLGGSPGETRNWPLYTESKERRKKEADPSRLVGGSSNSFHGPPSLSLSLKKKNPGRCVRFL